MSVKLEDVDENETVVKEVVKARPVIQDPLLGYYPINDLPSRYMLYPESTKIYGRPMRVLEVKQLSMMGEDNSLSIINSIMRSCVKGIRIDDILIADKMYILLWLRANTYKDSGYKVDFVCGKCEQQSKYHFDLDVLKVEYIKDEFVDAPPVVLPVSNDKIVLHYQTIGDTIEVENFKSKSLGNPLISYDDDILTLAVSISTINEKVLTLKQKYDYIINMDAQDYAMLETIQSEREIGISTAISVKCDKCKEVSPAGLSFRSEFFVPKYKK